MAAWVRAMGPLLAGLAGCGGCGEPADTTAPSTASTRAGPEPWTLGATDETDLVLPPTCAVTETLAAVAARRTQLRALGDDLARVVAIEGHLVPTRGRPRWTPDAAGVMTMRHGSAGVTSLPWTATASVAGRGTQPRVVWQRDDTWSLWHGEEASRRLPLATVAALACDGDRCAAVGRTQEGPAVWIDDDLADAEAGVVVPLPSPAPPISVAIDEAVTVGSEDELRLHLVEVADDLTIRPQAALPVVGGVLAVLATPSRALVRRESLGTTCEPDEGGVMVVSPTGSPSWLRSPLPARRGTLHRLGGDDLLATWSSPIRCGSSREVLHAAVTDLEGRLRGPVVEVGRSDGWAVATKGAEVALWVRRDEGGGARQTIRYVRARCRTRSSDDVAPPPAR